jgi:hypothetical protein
MTWPPSVRRVPSFPANVHARRREVREALKKPRAHSVMVVRCSFGDVVLRPRPK